MSTAAQQSPPNDATPSLNSAKAAAQLFATLCENVQVLLGRKGRAARALSAEEGWAGCPVKLALYIRAVVHGSEWCALRPSPLPSPRTRGAG